jgi:hypothetical protein
MADDTEKSVTTERGIGRALSPSDTGPYSPEAPGTGADWFGPLQPMQPIAPPEVAGRSWDFMPGWNLQTQPRGLEPVSFHALRSIAEAYDPLRLVIERRKDQMTRLPWIIRQKHEGPGKRPKGAQLSPAMRSRIDDVTDLFKRPEYGKGFRPFLRELLEDLFVLDQPIVHLKRDSGGGVVSLQNLDGATIKRVIDDWGRQPAPRPWNGEAFDWNGQSVTQANFLQSGWKYLDGIAYPPCWQQNLKGLPAVNYTALDLIVAPNNTRPGKPYGYSPVEQVMTTVATAMRRATSQLEYFREGNQPDAIYSLPATWTPDQIARYQDYWDALHSGNLGQRRKLKFMADGDYTALKEPPLKNEFDEWIVRIICFAFSYPPSAFMSLNNRSVVEQHDKSGEEEGLQGTKQWAADLFNDVIENHLGDDDIEFAWVEEDEIDQEKQSKILRGYAADGILTINEVRERLGEEPLTDPNANIPMVKTATGYVPIGATAEQPIKEKEDEDDIVGD